MQISIVIPLLNEEESLAELYQWLTKVLTINRFSYEIIFVDDGSTDGSWRVIMQLAEKDAQVRGIRFLRNYGKSQALHAGFKAAEGEVVITMDADLQDSPDEIPALYEMITKDNYDLVSGWKKKRYDSVLAKNLPSKLFNWAARKTSGLTLHDFNCGLKAYKKAVVKNIEVYGEMHRYIPYLAKEAGFKKIGEKVVHHQARKYGTTKFGINRFFNGYLDLITLWFLTNFGKKPMHVFGLLGSFVFFIGLIAFLWLIVEKIINLLSGIYGDLLTNHASFFIALTAMILGTQLFLAGFLGDLISRNSDRRNDYLIEEEINL